MTIKLTIKKAQKFILFHKSAFLPKSAILLDYNYNRTNERNDNYKQNYDITSYPNNIRLNRYKYTDDRNIEDNNNNLYCKICHKRNHTEKDCWNRNNNNYHPYLSKYNRNDRRDNYNNYNHNYNHRNYNNNNIHDNNNNNNDNNDNNNNGKNNFKKLVNERGV